MKYVKYFFPSFFLILAIFSCLYGQYYPTIVFIVFSLTAILGDLLFGRDMNVQKFSYPFILNFSLYINLPLLFILLFLTIFILTDYSSNWLVVMSDFYFNINIADIRNSFYLLDKIFLIAMTSLFIGTMGTVPGHELTHRKKSKFDMFIGNWLLALSWDCAFALEHVYGHHKNVCLPEDPATAKRGENIYGFVLRAIIKEQKDAWEIEIGHLKRKDLYSFGLNNRMIVGYLRSLIITLCAFVIGGLMGMLFYLLCAFIAKILLEVINYVEHYGLVREKGKRVYSRHSWNSNHVVSGILLCNVSRHSSHHEYANLKFWNLNPYPNAPMLPYGYLSMLYIALFLPFVYHRIMAKKLIDWDNRFATDKEREIAKFYNKISGIPSLNC